MSSHETNSIQAQQTVFLKQFDFWLEEYLAAQPKKVHFVDMLWKSKAYSLQSGGKRFRPFLSFLIYQVWSTDLIKIKNFCLAIEMIHTYSLIHDDLPCMDNDDLRRGKPTNHKVFGDAMALLAGDSLLTEAFQLISSDTKLSVDVRVELVRLLSEKIGSFGMVGGQVLDMQATKAIIHSELEEIHKLKTGYLIQMAAEGAAIIAAGSSSQRKIVSQFALALGLAFQIKDDLLDENDKEQDYKSYLAVLGKEKTIQELNKHTGTAKTLVHSLESEKAKLIIDLIDYNLQRNQ